MQQKYEKAAKKQDREPKGNKDVAKMQENSTENNRKGSIKA